VRPIPVLVLLAILASAGLFSPLRAQLPQVQVPGVPALPESTRAVTGSLRELAGARALRAERLLRENRADLDRDPRGELVVRAEVVAIDITEAALAKALDARFSVLRTEELPDLGVKITILQTPEGMSATRGLKRLRKLDPQGVYDFNHVYLDSGEVLTRDAHPAGRGRARDPGPTAGSASTYRLGLIDGGVDHRHSALAHLQMHHFGCGGQRVPNAHGTAVASLLVARRNVGQLYSADVYCGQPAGGAVDAVAAAFGWMARERVAVINVSLVGPRNALLERVVATLISRGHVIVAAVGNDGPAAPPLYPAAYDGVVGVTAVDAKHRVLIEAGRGKQVDFAALGAEVSAASQAPDQYATVRGTSFAAPQVAALLADLQYPNAAERDQRLARLTGEAHDLGKPGRDDVYGAGVLPAPISRVN
jgi:subtilisin family serine protease